MNKKDLLAKFISKVGLLYIFRVFLKLFADKIIILAYHRIYNMGNEDQFPFDPELISATPNDFRQQMLYIKKHYNPISFNDVLAYKNGKKKLPQNPIIITFDDGHEDNYSEAYPILKSLQMPATIFLSTDYIGSDDVFWFDWVAYVIYKTKSKTLSLNNGSFLITIEPSIALKRKSIKTVLKYLMTLKNKERVISLESIKKQLTIKISNCDIKKSSALSWAQVIEMNNNGIEFGSHTVSHPILSKLDDKELQYELSHSKSEIAARTGEPVDIIAYPVGGNTEYNENVINHCKALGYQLGISYISGVEKINFKKPFELKRIHIERYTTFERFKAAVAIPSIFD